jgi:hypothetical protein
MPPDPAQRQKFEADCDRLIDEIIHHLFKLTASRWRTVQFQLDAVLHPGGARSIQHRLWNPLTDESITDFPEELFNDTNRLHGLFQRHGQCWSRCLFTVRPQPGGKFDCTVDYHYPPAPPAT